MMKTAVYLTLLFTTLVLGACQKEMNFVDVTQPQYDSLSLVSTVTAINYDVNDNFLWRSEQLYKYGEPGGRTVVRFRDSTQNSIHIYTETFTYDDNKRLRRFETTNTPGYYSAIDFSYSGNGNLDKAVIYLLNGEQVENAFNHSSVNNNKVLTMFDTSLIAGSYTHDKPRIVRYTFNSDNQIISQLEVTTGPQKSQGNWLRDSFEYKYGYTAGQDINKMTLDYTFVSNGINTPHVRDSVAFFRDTRHTALYDTYRFIYKNLYWFSFSAYGNNSFASSMVHNSFYPHYVYYSKQPVRKIEYHSSVSPAAYRSQSNGFFENLYDREGRLIKSTYPKYFANNTWGKQLIEYEYMKVRK
jgi:hypothetical protein